MNRSYIMAKKATCAANAERIAAIELKLDLLLFTLGGGEAAPAVQDEVVLPANVGKAKPTVVDRFPQDGKSGEEIVYTPCGKKTAAALKVPTLYRWNGKKYAKVGAL
jgi:hypothetical protein